MSNDRKTSGLFFGLLINQRNPERALRLMKEHGSGYVYFVTHLEADAYRAIYDEGLRALEAGDLANGLRYLRELQIVS